VAYRFSIDLPGTPEPEVLSELIEAAAVSNTLWYLDQWNAGKDPACCMGCAGVLWKPDERAPESVCVALPAAFGKRAVSCHTAAAVAIGHERAIDIRDGSTWEEAAARHVVELHQRGSLVWHAFMRSRGKLRDPTEEMKRA
jgi:hypothetical protein